jgi:hypothetical protein
MDQKENKLYFSQLSFPESFPESFPSTEAPTVTAGMALAELQNHINELYAKILASQTEMSRLGCLISILIPIHYGKKTAIKNSILSLIRF